VRKICDAHGLFLLNFQLFRRPARKTDWPNGRGNFSRGGGTHDTTTRCGIRAVFARGNNSDDDDDDKKTKGEKVSNGGVVKRKEPENNNNQKGKNADRVLPLFKSDRGGK